MAPGIFWAESGELRKGEREKFKLTLDGNKKYAVLVDAAEPGVDFDLKIFDENNYEVDSDLNITADAIVHVEPRWTGEYTIVLSMERGASKYSIVVLENP